MRTISKFSLLVLLMVSACNVKVDTDKVKSKPSNHSDTSFIHTAYFWFKEDATATQIAAFKVDSEKLAGIETVQFFYAGGPAPTDRDVIENSYDYAIVFHFKDLADQEFYQKAPLHLEMIEKHQDIWEKVMVTDVQ